MFEKCILAIYRRFLGKIFDFILDILTRSWILSWISSKILPELARSWQDLGRSCKIFAKSWKILKEFGKIIEDIQDVELWV